MRYGYYWSRSKERVEETLEECLSLAEIFLSERPRIERRKSRTGKVFYVLTLEG